MTIPGPLWLAGYSHPLNASPSKVLNSTSSWPGIFSSSLKDKYRNPRQDLSRKVRIMHQRNGFLLGIYLSRFPVAQPKGLISGERKMVLSSVTSVMYNTKQIFLSPPVTQGCNAKAECTSDGRGRPKMLVSLYTRSS